MRFEQLAIDLPHMFTHPQHLHTNVLDTLSLANVLDTECFGYFELGTTRFRETEIIVCGVPVCPFQLSLVLSSLKDSPCYSPYH